jgi:sporadic carbohydrate cluster protein (TIGR04323 family)
VTSPLRLRGYVTAGRPTGRYVAQSVQNAVLRDHCRRRGADYVLSATEFSLPGSSVAWYDVVDDVFAGRVDGIVTFDRFGLPGCGRSRWDMVRTIIARGGELHLAAEGIVVRSESDVEQLALVERIRDSIEHRADDVMSALTAPDLQRCEPTGASEGHRNLHAAVTVR